MKRAREKEGKSIVFVGPNRVDVRLYGLQNRSLRKGDGDFGRKRVIVFSLFLSLSLSLPIIVGNAMILLSPLRFSLSLSRERERERDAGIKEMVHIACISWSVERRLYY